MAITKSQTFSSSVAEIQPRKDLVKSEAILTSWHCKKFRDNLKTFFFASQMILKNEEKTKSVRAHQFSSINPLKHSGVLLLSQLFQSILGRCIQERRRKKSRGSGEKRGYPSRCVVIHETVRNAEIHK
jgi:hypothetical protein